VNTTDPLEVTAALEHAKRLADAGVPLFVADGDPAGIGHNGTGYWMPKGWQTTAPDPAVADGWRPGMALCAVTGHRQDVVDVDPRSGGAESVATLNGTLPRSYGLAETPSGGMHSFAAPLGVRSRNGVLPGLDVKAGVSEGGRGFAFLAPTVRRTSQWRRYRHRFR
jgi:hypothetical protein